MTEEGWKFGSVGESPVTFTDKPAEFSKPDAVVNKFKDEFGNPKNFPAPDYDSGWIDVSNDDVKHTLTHDLGCLPIMYIAWFTPDSTYNDGYPTKCYPMVNGLIRHGGSSWSGVELLFNSTEVQYTCDATHHVYTNYRLDSGGDSWTDYNDGYMRLALWK